MKQLGQPAERLRNFTFCTLIFVFLLCTFYTVTAQSSESLQSRQILDATGIRGGLIVHVGCGDGELTAALRAGDSYLVDGLD
ncbi:MAG: hypothetical protein JSW59_13455, partial [Phycisphaerales bacterium]